MTIYDVWDILIRDGYTKDEIIELFEFKYHEKNITEWFEEAHKAEGLDEFGFPNWYEPMANVELGLAVAKTMMAERKKLENETKEN